MRLCMILFGLAGAFAIGMLVWALLVLFGVLGDPHEGEHCTSHHYQPIVTGKSIAMIPLCDQWVPNAVAS